MDRELGGFRPTVARIDLGAVVHNVRALGALTPAGTAFMAVVKADAYGHGAVPVARAARDAGASWFGVALLEEALELREAGLSEPVLVLGAVPPSAAPAAVGADVRLALFDPDLARALDAAARGRGRPARVHLKIDTGMGRVGVRPEDLPAFLDLLGTLPAVEIEGGVHPFRHGRRARPYVRPGAVGAVPRLPGASRRPGRPPPDPSRGEHGRHPGAARVPPGPRAGRDRALRHLPFGGGGAVGRPPAGAPLDHPDRPPEGRARRDPPSPTAAPT